MSPIRRIAGWELHKSVYAKISGLLSMIKKKVAVIGSGISGLGVSYLLSSKYEVYLFEKNSRFGGHTNTITVPLQNKEVKVDTGFIVYNDHNYQNFSRLLKHLNVQSKWSDMSLGFSFDGGNFEYACDNLGKIFAQKKNIFNLNYLKSLIEILKFNREAPKSLDAGELSGLSMAGFLTKYNYSRFFRERFILPMAGAIWSTSLEKVLDFPAENFISFFRNHDLMTGLGQAQKWRTLEGGSKLYVEEIIRRLGNRNKTNAEVVKVNRTEAGCKISFMDGHTRNFNDVIFAIPAPFVRDLLANQSTTEVSILSKFNTTKNRAVLHSDTRCMPQMKKVWSSWNFLHNFSGKLEGSPPAVTYWMNRLQGIDKSHNFFVSLNPRENIEKSKVYYETEYDHPQFDLDTLNAQKKIERIQGAGGIWYAGAWLGYGFHEDGFLSAIKIAKKFDCFPKWLNDID